MTPPEFAVPDPRLQQITRYLIVLGLVLICLALLAAPASWAVDTGPTHAIGQDVYYKAEGPLSGPPAPRLTVRDYPEIPLPWPFSESRIVMWVLGQQHLYFGAFGLLSAVPRMKWIFLVLSLCAMVYISPHWLVMRAAGLARLDLALIGLFVGGAANIVALGIMGYYLPVACPRSRAWLHRPFGHRSAGSLTGIRGIL